MLWSLAQDDCQFANGICIQLSSDQTSLNFQATRKEKTGITLILKSCEFYQKAEVALAQAASTSFMQINF